MKPVFIGVPIEFDAMLQRLRAAERPRNEGRLLPASGFLLPDPRAMGVCLGIRPGRRNENIHQFKVEMPK
jgi:hypothetical protein